MPLTNSAAMRAATAMSLPALLIATAALAGGPDFTISVLVRDGDVFSPHGTVSNINDVFVNDNGDWIADVSLTGGTASGALIKNGEVWLAVGDFLPLSILLPISAPVTSLTNLLKHMNSHGDVAFRPTLMGTPNSGIYLNTLPLLVNGQTSNAPEFSKGTLYGGFFRARVTDGGDVFAVTTVDDPAIASTVDRALLWLNYDSRSGMVIEQVLAKEADPAPGTEPGVVFADFGTSADSHAINNSREALYAASLTGGSVPTTTNAGLYINHDLVLRKGDPAPMDIDATYNNIGTSTRMHMNASRQYVFIGTFTSSAGGGTVLARGNGNARGDTMILHLLNGPAPDTGGSTITSFGTGVQPHITDGGDVVWYAQLSGDAALNQALFINDHVLMRKGVTAVGGQTVTTVAGTVAASNGIGSTVVASPNGRFVITRSVLAAGPRAALLIEFPQPKCALADLNCDTVVNGLDLGILLINWSIPPGAPGCGGALPCASDLNGDGQVNGLDLGILLANWTL
jgi:hypothetical protein